MNYSNQTRTTGIEWCSHTWNPFVGCSIKSAGCLNCYAAPLASKLASWGNSAYEETTEVIKSNAQWTGVIKMNSEAAIKKPLKISEPSIIFVNSMSDFFHANATDEMRLIAWRIMADTPRHQYQVLTKRPENINPFLERNKIEVPSNIWLGATVESKLVRDRIDILREVPARIRFLSVEPLIADPGDLNLEGIHWVITGGESGPGARPMKAEWIEKVDVACKKYGTKHFFKQYGKADNNPIYIDAVARGIKSPKSYLEKQDPIGKGGSLLNGKYVKEMPNNYEVAAFDKSLEGVKV